jgi:hypothetical protein
MTKSKKPQIEKHYRKRAKDLVDLLFDKRFLNNDLSRDSINWLEDYLAFCEQSSCEMAAKCALLTAKMRDKG